MPPLVLFAIFGAGALATYKLLDKLVRQAQTPSPSEVERIRREAAERRARYGSATRDLGELEWDEKTAAYRPRNSNSG